MTKAIHDQDQFDSGFDSGREIEKVEIAKNLIYRGLTIEEVSEDTGVPVEEVERLKEAI